MELGEVLGIHRVLVDSTQSFKQMAKILLEAPAVAFDTETTSLDYLGCSLVGMSFCDGHTAWYVPIRHETDKWQVPWKTLVDFLQELFSDPERVIVAHNFKFDYQVIRACTGIIIKGQWRDTMIEAWLVDENQRLGLKVLSKSLLSYDQKTFEEVAGKEAKFVSADLEEAGKYGADDALTTWLIHEKQYASLVAQNLEQVYLNVEVPTIQVLGDMEYEGVLIDRPFLQRYGEWLTEEIQRERNVIHEMVGHEFNIGSTKQLGDVLFTQMGYPILKSTKNGAPSTDSEVMENLANRGYEVAVHIDRFKKLSKLKGTYVVGLLDRLREDNTLHGSLNQTGTHTGRLSSSDPNLQNIPIRTKEGRMIRQAFIPATVNPFRLVSEVYPEGIDLSGEGVFISVDFSQIELRVLAHFSKDPAMVKAFQDGLDFHIDTASKISGIPYEKFVEAKNKDEMLSELKFRLEQEADPEKREELEKQIAENALTPEDERCLILRQRAKNVNFGIPYGQGPSGLAYITGMSMPEAKNFLNRHRSVFSGVWSFIDGVKLSAKKNGYITMLFGRKRRLPEIYSSNNAVRASVERQSVNNKIQGSAGDLMKGAMIRLHNDTLPKYGAKLLIQVHDELLIWCPRETAEAALEATKKTMTSVVTLRVPLAVSGKICKNWAEGH